jgi:hypothetical protein
MNTQLNRIITFTVVFVVIILSPMLVLAGVDGVPGNPDNNAPIDGGLSLLVAAGVGYGAKKLRDKRKI